MMIDSEELKSKLSGVHYCGKECGLDSNSSAMVEWKDIMNIIKELELGDIHDNK